MVTLYDVVDTRNGKYYSVVIVKASKAKWFVPYEPQEEGEED